MTNQSNGIITKVSGPLVVAEGMNKAKMFEVVRVSEKKLIGEIIELKGDKASIQVYEDTSGLGPGEPVYLTGELLKVELGPGLLTSIYDGIQRPLAEIAKVAGEYITRGIDVPGLDQTKKWNFRPVMGKGDKVKSGDIIGEVAETSLITHKIMAPFGISGEISEIKSGNFTINDTVAQIVETGQCPVSSAESKKSKTHNITMKQVWPIRQPRPVKRKLVPTEPLVSGQRIIDTFFPIVKGGTGCVPGPFGSGKTVVQHQLAKWADADIIVFIGCGERGNEMTDVLMEFPELKDPASGKPLMERTILIANTSNMPVAAREASVYTGITLAEYFRDMGYKVALMADSTSRWAEALREMSGRLEEMPGEEGYPAYLGSRTASFYERAGLVKCLGGGDREGSLTVIGAVSPPGGDLSEPVTQNTLRVTKVFWGLDSQLAYRRHFPAINWLNSYSLYLESIDPYLKEHAGTDFPALRDEAMKLLQQEAKLEEIVRLVGIDALSEKEQLVLDTTKTIREDFLHQNAFDDIDTYTSLKKQYWMLKIILLFHHKASEAIENGVPLKDLTSLPIKNKIARNKMISENALEEFKKMEEEVVEEIEGLGK
ncbi:V-type ATP synthase subunit A [Candidatus Falkowbacteria bacterium RBG_13_39_14]|uniref:V-type ATP synthase alpha chain n=1 Tax=Candidatus Falkowbacteria bacterium RBG_13_39_14 TaxID=1797985 RepID=A0A1F5S6G3_9BACT|nr:MAG: V-type ATP synthase subunit A [Candidatus Falkowbacteria bacterium RBG_13_39_14]